MNIDHFNVSIAPNDTILYPNSYVKKLNDDFKSDLIKWEKVDLGIIGYWNYKKRRTFES